jgi:hypothetical protein
MSMAAKKIGVKNESMNKKTTEEYLHILREQIQRYSPDHALDI